MYDDTKLPVDIDQTQEKLGKNAINESNMETACKCECDNEGACSNREGGMCMKFDILTKFDLSK